MPLPMPEEEEKFRCPHGERNQALMLCSLDCDLSGAHPDRKAKADGRFIIRRGGACISAGGSRNIETRFDLWQRSRTEETKNSTFRHESEGGVFW